MKNILFLTDFSTNAKKALKVALQIANDFNATLFMVNAFEVPITKTIPTTEIFFNSVKQKSQNDLINCVKEIKCSPKFKHLLIITKAISGTVIDAVKIIEHETPLDLIILGTKGASGIKEIFIGSNAKQVVHHSQTSTLIIPEEAPPFSFKKTTIAIDLKPIKDPTVISTFTIICAKYKTDNCLVNVINENIDEPHSVEEISKIISLFKHINHSFHTIVNEDVVDGINLFIENNPTNVLVILSRNHSFFDSIFHKSVTNKITHHSKLPIFVLKEKLKIC